MVTGELPAVTFVRSLLNPVTIVASLFACTFFYGENFAGHYLALGILVFLISTQVFDEVEVFRP
jgi:putative colanic acid biosysnthesis UDP-glucose lipid carrier transferase